jgi:hypothetical protein
MTAFALHEEVEASDRAELSLRLPDEEEGNRLAIVGFDAHRRPRLGIFVEDLLSLRSKLRSEDLSLRSKFRSLVEDAGRSLILPLLSKGDDTLLSSLLLLLLLLLFLLLLLLLLLLLGDSSMFIL